MAQLGNGKSAFQDRKFILTAPVDSNGDPAYDGGIERGDTGDDITAQVLAGLLGAGGTKIDVLHSGAAYAVKIYTSDTAGIMIATERKLSTRLDLTSTPYTENFDYTFLQPFKTGTIPSVLHDCTYRSDDDRTRWRTHVRRESSGTGLNDGGGTYSNESVRVRLYQGSNTGVAQRSFVTIYAIGEFDDTEL